MVCALTFDHQQQAGPHQFADVEILSNVLRCYPQIYEPSVIHLQRTRAYVLDSFVASESAVLIIRSIICTKFMALLLMCSRELDNNEHGHTELQLTGAALGSISEC